MGEPAARTLTHEEARAFYDDFGDKQDRQAFYEDEALRALVANSAFDRADSVLELGCGTGRFALELLQQHLPATARYHGTDISATMVQLAVERLAPFASRATVALADERPTFTVKDASVDRFVSSYVLDLLPPLQQQQFLAEAARVLRPDGLLCLVGITPGTTAVSRTVMGLWQWLFRRNPRWVGGCRPVRITEYLSADVWHLRYRAVVVSWGVASEVVIAAPVTRTP